MFWLYEAVADVLRSSIIAEGNGRLTAKILVGLD